MFVIETTFPTVASIDNSKKMIMLLQLKLLYMFLYKFELKLAIFQNVYSEFGIFVYTEDFQLRYVYTVLEPSIFNIATASTCKILEIWIFFSNVSIL